MLIHLENICRHELKSIEMDSATLLVIMHFESHCSFILTFFFLRKSNIFDSDKALVFSCFDKWVFLQDEAVGLPVYSLVNNEADLNIKLMKIDIVNTSFQVFKNDDTIFKSISFLKDCILKAILYYSCLIWYLCYSKSASIEKSAWEWNFNLFSFKNVDLIRVWDNLSFRAQCPLNALLTIDTVYHCLNLINVLKRT